MLIPAALLFFLSGFAALVYQVTWQRLLVIFSGADVYSATIVVAAFMAGLGCGTIVGGQVADRVSAFRSLMLFALAEAGIAAFGAFSAFFFYDILYHRLGHLAGSPAATAAMLFVSLLWPTFLMGVSLPLLARALVRDTAAAASTIGWLYSANTLGAAIGALAATWWWLPRHGLEGTVRAAALLNVVCAVGAVPLARLVARAGRPVAAAEAGTATVEHAASGVSLSRWMGLYGLAGFIALSFEIVWFRMLGVMLKSTSVTFGTLLSQYLIWLGLGSACGSLVARRVTRPATVFLWAQAGAAVYAAAVVAVSVTLLPDASSLADWYEYLGAFEPTGQPFRRYVAISAIVIGPATFLMGFGFPLLQRAVQTDLAYLGRRVGALLVANIAGSTAGTIVTGWVLLGMLGTSGTIRALVAASGVFGVLAIAGTRVRTRVAVALYGAVAVAIAAVAAAVPPGRVLWGTLHGAEPRTVLAAEDGSGVSLLKGTSRDLSGGVVVFVNGLGQSWLPYGGIHSELGALPAMIHPDPRDAAVIGLGSGDTLWAVAGRRELERITSIEIVRPQLQTLRDLLGIYPYPALAAWLDDRRIEQVFDDGRAYVRKRAGAFDILEADALRPTSAYAGNLYSDEYFALLLRHLKPGGLAVTWAPTERVRRTFLRVVPYAVQSGDVMVGSNQPIVIDHAAVQRRIADPAVQAYYAQGGVDIQELMGRRLQGVVAHRLSDAERAAIADVNTDLFPRDELGR